VSKSFKCFLLFLLALVPNAANSPFLFKAIGAAYDGSADPARQAAALRWYRQAAERGDAGAAVILGSAFFIGRGVPQDWTLAVIWWRQAANEGDTDAEFLLSQAYCNGIGMPVDEPHAQQWWQRAAAHGNPAAQANQPSACYGPPKRQRHPGSRRLPDAQI
jgi:uncharacterized protein